MRPSGLCPVAACVASVYMHSYSGTRVQYFTLNTDHASCVCASSNRVLAVRCDEAVTCGHLLLQCISKWTAVQLDKDNTLKSLACPLCKQPYTSILYDCRTKFFR